ncbi:DoxX family membrane protein [Streptomyces sp. NPDC057445]|uniref:DoxX family membrane protein n=1 Tax=Streptomyces sp. NPDC057445 TaxID=3346136 RepID=UPI0036CDBC9A
MSVDTRTPRAGFDEQPSLSMAKVNCDPAQVIVNHASFRVKLGPSQPTRGVAETARIPAGRGAGAAARRRAPVVWSGRSAPGDPGATGLLQAVRSSGAVTHTGAHTGGGFDGAGFEGAGFERPGFDGAGFERPGFDGTDFDGSGFERPGIGGPGFEGTGFEGTGFERPGFEQPGFEGGATQVIPRVGRSSDPDTVRTPVVGRPGGPLLPPMRQAEGAYDAYEPYGQEADEEPDFGYEPRRRGPAADPGVRHAYYPGRRMNLGVVLLPLRVFLGLISIYAGMGKLCDPVYFDGGERGSMVKWLNSLDPWTLAGPLRDFALSHPVGAGLTVAFLQVVVGVLTVLGLWQRVAAVVGALLSAALIMTVSWRTAPAYDAPDIINLAAWSPLIIAGAPVYSVDGRLAGEAWRRLGPRTELRELRRRVLRRGGVLAAVVVGLTLLVGSILGGAVRSTELVTVPGPNVDPTNHLPGSPLPQESGERSPSREAKHRPEPARSETSSPAAEKAEPSETAGETGSVGQAGSPSQSQGTGSRQPPARSQPAEQAPSSSSGPATGGGATGGNGSGGGGTGGGSGDGGSGGNGGGSGGGNRNPIGGLLG